MEISCAPRRRRILPASPGRPLPVRRTLELALTVEWADAIVDDAPTPYCP